MYIYIDIYRRLVCRSVSPSVIFVKKWLLEYQQVIKTYLPTYLWDSSDSSEISDSLDSSDSNDSSEKSDQKNSQKKTFFFFNILYHK